jgi:hypothetical protein
MQLTFKVFFIREKHKNKNKISFISSTGFIISKFLRFNLDSKFKKLVVVPDFFKRKTLSDFQKLTQKRC